MKVKEKNVFWKHFIQAAGAEFREAKIIRGVSGQDHPVLAVGVDANSSRLVLISGEQDARAAVLAQSDIQAAVGNLKVLTARPVAVNLSKAAAKLIDVVGSSNPTIKMLEVLQGKEGQDSLERSLKPYMETLDHALRIANLDALFQMLEAIKQFSKIELITQPTAKRSGKPMRTLKGFKLRPLALANPIQQDLDVGICPVPLYDFSESDFETILNGSTEKARHVLHSRDLLQYFYPPSDHLVLGLVDRGIKDPNGLITQIGRTSELGHPVAKPEFFPKPGISPHDVIAQLQDRGFLVEGEIGFEISEEAQSSRLSVKFKPREGLISKLINRISVNLSLKDLFK